MKRSWFYAGVSTVSAADTVLTPATWHGLAQARRPQGEHGKSECRDKQAHPFTTVVKTTARRLRAKLGDPPVIHTVREGGYQIGAT